MLGLEIKAPFAVFRTFSAGSFRPSADFITPSAAYGLLLNIAGIEMRKDDGKSPMTLIRKNEDLPRFRIAIAALGNFPSSHTIYQQLHNYPVGAETGKQYIDGAKGSKYNITPVRRTFLHGFHAYVALDANHDFEQSILDGLSGNTPRQYGLPFLGDNNFLIDSIKIVSDLQEAYWYEPIDSSNGAEVRDRVTRLTISIDRADMSQTRSKLFATRSKPVKEVPVTAWIEVGY